MTRRTLVISLSALSAVVVIGAVAAVVALNMVNRRAEGQVQTQLDSALQQSGIADQLTYDAVSAEALQGRVSIEGIAFAEEGVNLSIDTLSIELPRDEALALARDFADAQITDIAVTASRMTLIDEAEELSVGTEELGMHFRGNLPTALFSEDTGPEVDPAALVVNTVGLSLAGGSLTLPENAGAFRLGSYDSEIQGNVTGADLAAAVDLPAALAAALEDSASLSVELADLALDLNESALSEMLSEIEMMLGPVTMLENPENRRIDSMALTGTADGSGVELSSLSGSAEFLEFEASGALGFSDELLPAPPLQIDLEVEHYEEELRPLFEILAQQIAMSALPEGNSFSFSLAMQDEEGVPEITLE
jgi:hypothetical protein